VQLGENKEIVEKQQKTAYEISKFLYCNGMYGHCSTKWKD